MTKPLIGITASRTTNDKDIPIISLNEVYVKAVYQNGGCPLIIPLGLEETDILNIAARLDGCLFSGGGDIHPIRYEGSPHPLVEGVDANRDQVELTLLSVVMDRNLPFLGICRGLQLINVGLGGSLYEDIHDQNPGAIQHQLSGIQERTYRAHSIRVDPSSQLAGILESDNIQVNSFHHQGIRLLAPDLKAVAYAPDGIIEAVEVMNHRFGLAVQWHPEWMLDDPAMRSIFQSFAQAASNA